MPPLFRSPFARRLFRLPALCLAIVTAQSALADTPQPAAAEPVTMRVQVGPRPHYLVDQLADGELKRRLEACREQPVRRTLFSIAHRGAPLQFPEHTREGYEAAVRMGAGIVECDVTFTRDRELVCRHSQCDLHATTNILLTPLAARCSQPFTPARGAEPARARCCTSDLSLAEFRSLRGKMDGVNPRATTVAEFIAGTPGWRTEAYAATGTLMSHRDSIDLLGRLGVGMAPELKAPEVPMPFDGDFSREAYAQRLIDDYRDAGVAPERVWPQSFDAADLRYWLANEPDFARQAVALVALGSPADLPGAIAALPRLRDGGVRILAPPTWALVTLDERGEIVPSGYARRVRGLGFDMIGWTLERSGTLVDGGGYFFQSIRPTVHGPSDYLRLMHVLAQDVGVIGLFSDWPATVSYYASCTGRR